MFKELKKFVKDNPIRVTVCEKTLISYAYTFSDNTVAYYILDDNIDVPNDLILPNADDFENIQDAINDDENVIFDENPYDFYMGSIEIYDKAEVSANKFVKSLAGFTKFYDTDNIHSEYRGIHINDGNMFSTNSYVMRIIKSETFQKSTNLVIDFKPVVEYMGIDTKKIKSTGKSLFAAKTKNDNVKLSTYKKGDDDILHIEYKDLMFINHSICKSDLDFKFVENSSKNLDKTIKVYRKDLYKALNSLLNESIKDKNKVKNAFVFEQKDEKLLIYPYIKFKEDRGNILETVNAQSNIDTKLITNGENLLNILKQINDEIIELKHNSDSKICKITSKTSKEDYYLIFNV